MFDQILINYINKPRGHSYVYCLQLDWEDVSDKVLKSLVDGGVNLAEQRNFSISRHPLVRLCRRTLDGHELLEMFSRSLTSISQKFRNRMLEEAIRRGSFSTARVNES